MFILYALTAYGKTKRISKSNNKKSRANMKNDILNWLLFCPKKEWNPHSKTLFFSSYGLCGANIIFINSKIIDNNGINIKKKIILLI